MAMDPRSSVFSQGRAGTVADAQIDEGLRAYMLKVYNYMGSAVLLSGIVAYAVAHTPSVFNAIYGSPLQWVVMLAPLGLVMLLSARIQKMSATSAQATFWVFAALMGASLSYIFLVYTQTSIVRVFMITSVTFGAMSLWGYTTKKDLSGFGSFLMMGLIGIIVASVVNIFMQSDMMHWVISVVGVLVFVGLTAYDTQKIKNNYLESDGQATMSKKAIMGALMLYLDFINLFLMMLHLFGNRE